MLKKDVFTVWTYNMQQELEDVKRCLYGPIGPKPFITKWTKLLYVDYRGLGMGLVWDKL